MKKTYIYTILLTLLFFGFNACDDELDVAPKNIIYDEDIFTNESGIETYLVSLYWDLPMEDFNYTAGILYRYPTYTVVAGTRFLPLLSDEGIPKQRVHANGYIPTWWRYEPINHVNGFIKKIVEADFPESKINHWLGEAKFIRAYYYFGLVKRYGGVPLIKENQVIESDNLEELQVPRNSEKEIYDFISSELDEAAELMAETTAPGKANKYAAYALKSRAMLYAASIAKYGDYQLDGLLGFPEGSADTYWQAAYDAAKKIMDSGLYSLYEKNPDKAQNFGEMFLAEDNPEAIFIRQYNDPDVPQSWDVYMLPHRFLGGYGSSVCPTLEMVEAFEYVDGSPGNLKLTDAQGDPIEYDNPVDIFNDKDPRFFATVLCPFSDWHGNIMEIRAGIIVNGEKITTGNYNDLYEYNGSNIHIIGWHGIGGNRQLSPTGFYLRKYLNPAYDPSEVKKFTSFQSFMDYRYGEILLNFAEAAVELGRLEDAKMAVNLLRERAGIGLLETSEVTVDKVRHERRVELAFEPHRYWDIIRWRTATSVLNNTLFHTLLPYWNLDNNTYVFETQNTLDNGRGKIFQTKKYYLEIPGLESNPNLVQNPEY